ncbi:MAG: MBL fold metallo-hydrolase, partial [Verrucomicrobiales bacterium]
HTATVGEAAREFGCPVYAVAEVADALVNPGAWFLPGLSPNAVDKVTTLADGEVLPWKNYKLTAHFFPGQMYNHGALLAERKDHAPVLFVGDSFSPSGLDDYCLMNRNLMREDTGFFLCLRKVRGLPEGSWMVNQHIPHLFRFSKERLDLLEKRYAERRDLIADLTYWDNPNFAIDDRWASFYPYGQALKSDQGGSLKVQLWNHSTRGREMRVLLHLPEGISADQTEVSVKIPARARGQVDFKITTTATAAPGVKVITADLASDDFSLERWAEALVKVE